MDILNLLSQGWLPNLLGLIGGLLGMYTFIDTYLMKFCPKIYFGTKVIIEASKVKDFYQLDSIFCSLELCNHRKKYGVAYDFAVRIYKSDQINSDKAIYYASKIIKKIPINISGIEKQEFEMYSPITILPSSNKSINLVLSRALDGSKLRISPSINYFIEIYYQKKPKGKWSFIDKLYLNNTYDPYKKDIDKYIEFTVLDFYKTREKLDKAIHKQKTNLYNGISYIYIVKILNRYFYKLIKKPYSWLIDIFVSAFLYLHFIINDIIDRLIKIPLINKYGKSILKYNIRIGSPKLRPITEESFEKIFAILQKISKKFNFGTKKEAKMNIEKKDRCICVSRYKLSIKFYIAGDSCIYVQTIEKSKFTYHIDLKKRVWNKEYWYLDNYGFITIHSFVVKVLDAFILYSNT